MFNALGGLGGGGRANAHLADEMVLFTFSVGRRELAEMD
jgi:hypothetical protein